MKRPLVENDRAWAASPCSTCATSPCCTRLPLQRFHIETRGDFARALEIAAHPSIELGLYDSGWWMAYYLAPCRFLNPLDSKCLIHGSARRPEICRSYSPAGCWYKRVFVSGDPANFIRFDLARLAALERAITFDEGDEIASVPPWEEMQAAIGSIPLADSGLSSAVIDPDVEPSRVKDAAHAPATGRRTVHQGGILFPLPTPRSRGDLDMMRFRLGFHGVRIGICGESWVLAVGSPSGLEPYLVVAYEQCDALLASFELDETGRIVRAPALRPRDEPEARPTGEAIPG